MAKLWSNGHVARTDGRYLYSASFGIIERLLRNLGADALSKNENAEVTCRRVVDEGKRQFLFVLYPHPADVTVLTTLSL